MALALSVTLPFCSCHVFSLYFFFEFFTSLVAGNVFYMAVGTLGFSPRVSAILEWVKTCLPITNCWRNVRISGNCNIVWGSLFLVFCLGKLRPCGVGIL